MVDIIRGLGDLLLPHGVSQLEAAIADRERLYLKTGGKSAFQQLIDWRSLNSLISLDRILSGDIRIVRNNRDLPVEMFSSFDTEKGVRAIVPEILQGLCRDGISIVFNRIDKMVAAIGAMGAMIERQLDCRTGVNAYLSFARDSAFLPHQDDHNVLIMQIHGRKDWKCYGGHKGAAPGEIGSTADPRPEWAGTLEPGDVLYIPRGDMHAGVVNGSHSLHLTIEVSPARGSNFMDWVMRRMRGEEFFDGEIMSHAQTNEERSASLDRLKGRVIEFIGSIDEQAFVSHWRNSAPARDAMNLGISCDLAGTTWIKPALGSRIILPEIVGGDVRIGGRKLTLSAAEYAVLKQLEKQDALRFEEVLELASDFEEAEIKAAVMGLADKSLIFLFD